jgi:hypothetical protein
MTQRNRKLIGVFVLLGSIAAWVAVFTALYLVLPTDWPNWLVLAYFVVAGMGWLYPAIAIIRWMSKPD